MNRCPTEHWKEQTPAWLTVLLQMITDTGDTTLLAPINTVISSVVNKRVPHCIHKTGTISREYINARCINSDPEA